jgi:hypothetical protein
LVECCVIRKHTAQIEKAAELDHAQLEIIERRSQCADGATY